MVCMGSASRGATVNDSLWSLKHYLHVVFLFLETCPNLGVLLVEEIAR
jgi:hypothetical protein